MATSQVTIFSFPCIKIHQTSSIHEPRGNTLPKIQNGGIPFFLPYEHICQQTRAGHHTNHS